MPIDTVNSQLPIFNEIILFIIIIMGSIIAIKKPYWGYLFALFLPIALSIPTMTFSRFSSLGSYFNLYDASLLIVIISLISETKLTNTPYRWPNLPFAMMGVLILGFGITTAQFGFRYETLRALRWGIDIPLFFLAAFVMLRDERRHSALLIVLVGGAVVAEAQHLYFVLTNPSLMVESEVSLLRSTMFGLSNSLPLLLAGFYLVGRTVKWLWLQIAIGALFLVVAISTQTRSWALGLIGGLFLSTIFLSKLDPIRWRKNLVLVITLTLGMTIILPFFNLSGAARNLQSRFHGLVEGEAEASNGRNEAAAAELGDWMNTNLAVVVAGNGLDYFTTKYQLGVSELGNIAFGHLGYLTYLSQLGIIGFLIYGVWFPMAVIRRAATVFRHSFLPSTRYLAVLAAASFFFCIVTFFFSGSFLMRNPVVATLAGFAFVMSGWPSRAFGAKGASISG